MRRLSFVTMLGVLVLSVCGCGAILESRAPPRGGPPAPPDVVPPAASAWQDVVAAPPRSEAAVLSGAPAIRRTRGVTQALRLPKRVAQAHASEAPTATAPAAARPTDDEVQQKLVMSGAVEISATDVRATANAVRAGAVARGGVVVSDELSGAKYGVHARFQVRLPPDEVAPFVAWLGTQGALESSQLSTSDVSREYFDEELRLRTLRGEMDRLQKLMAEHPNASLDDVLAIERETTRVRADIERLEGQHRYLGDRVARATLDVHITAHDEFVVGAPEQKFVLMAHGLASSFVDAGSRHRDRLGAGVAILFGRRFDLTFDVLPSRDSDARSMLLTAGGAVYSDFLGGGRRVFGNPYLGLRLGGGGINGRGAFTYAGELGVELVRHPHFVVDLTGRALGLLYGKAPRSDIAFQGVLGVGVPF